jgi:hypothetical protein
LDLVHVKKVGLETVDVYRKFFLEYFVHDFQTFLLKMRKWYRPEGTDTGILDSCFFADTDKDTLPVEGVSKPPCLTPHSSPIWTPRGPRKRKRVSRIHHSPSSNDGSDKDMKCDENSNTVDESNTRRHSQEKCDQPPDKIHRFGNVLNPHDRC